MTPTPSKIHVVHSDIDVKFWMEHVPSVERARPGRCPCCGAATRPTGHALGLVGHGLRERQLRGPRQAGARPELLVIRVRRYRCRHCRAVCTVVPRGVVRRRHFGAGAIGWALFLYGHERQPARAVRDRLGGYGSQEAADWITLRRWRAAVADGRLFSVRPSPADFTPRQVAERAAMTFASFAPIDAGSASLAAQVFVGAEIVARAA